MESKRSGGNPVDERLRGLAAALCDVNKDVALTAALEILDIDPSAYSRIHSDELKRDFLQYKFQLVEIEFCKPEYASRATQFFNILKLARENIEKSSLTTDTPIRYSKMSYGLTELDIRKPRKQTDFSQSVIMVGEKKGGVEPGFEAIQAKDILLHLYQQYPEREKRVAVIREAGCDLMQLYRRFKADLPTYMVKLDYQKLEDGKVVPEREDLMRANTVQTICDKAEILTDLVIWVYQQSKSTTIEGKNAEAVLEAVASDEARLFMDVHKQTLYQGHFENGCWKLMLKSEWMKGASTLGPLAGDEKDNKFRARKVLAPKKLGRSGVLIQFASDQNIKNIGEILPILLVQGDRDAIGSKGQNKLRVGNRFVAIDFGHAYALSESIIKQVTKNFHIQHPAFKNYSIFYDVPRSEIVRGVIKLAALNGKYRLDASMLESYGADFAKEVAAIEKDADMQIFKDYCDKFEEIKEQFKARDDDPAVKNTNIKSCEVIIEELKKARDRHKEARDQMVEKFHDYLNISAQAIDLLESLEKLSMPLDQLSLLSPDGTMVLNRLRVKDDSKIPNWNVEVGHKGRHEYTVTFSSETQAKEAENKMKEMLPQGLHLSYELRRVGKTIRFAFDQVYLRNFHSIYHEDKIQEKYFPEERAIQQQFLGETKLADLLGKLEEFNVAGKLETDDSENYIFTLQPKTINPAFFEYVYKNLRSSKIDFQCSAEGLKCKVPYKNITHLYGSIALTMEEVTEAQRPSDSASVFPSATSQMGFK